MKGQGQDDGGELRNSRSWQGGATLEWKVGRGIQVQFCSKKKV